MKTSVFSLLFIAIVSIASPLSYAGTPGDQNSTITCVDSDSQRTVFEFVTNGSAVISVQEFGINSVTAQLVKGVVRDVTGALTASGLRKVEIYSDSNQRITALVDVYGGKVTVEKASLDNGTVSVEALTCKQSLF